MTWTNAQGTTTSGLMNGNATFDAQGGLLAFDDSSGRKLLERGVPTDVGSNGVLSWGRWTDGKVNGTGTSNVATLHYFTLSSVPTGPTAGLFTSFASTAPTVQSSGTVVATGTVNGATGTVTAALLLNILGTATYSLSVPVSGQTFTLTGTATQTTLTSFSGISLITSTGGGCPLLGCTGSLGNNVSVIGQVAGSTGSNIGVLYGFDSRLGNISGVIVFKR